MNSAPRPLSSESWRFDAQPVGPLSGRGEPVHELNAALVPRGFQAAQGELPDTGETQLIWCAFFPEFAKRWPQLPQAVDSGYLPDWGGCVDLWLEISDACIATPPHFEAQDLAETLRELGHDQLAARMDDVVGVRLDQAWPLIADAARALMPLEANPS